MWESRWPFLLWQWVSFSWFSSCFLPLNSLCFVIFCFFCFVLWVPSCVSPLHFNSFSVYVSIYLTRVLPPLASTTCPWSFHFWNPRYFLKQAKNQCMCTKLIFCNNSQQEKHLLHLEVSIIDFIFVGTIHMTFCLVSNTAGDWLCFVALVNLHVPT